MARRRRFFEGMHEPALDGEELRGYKDGEGGGVMIGLAAGGVGGGGYTSETSCSSSEIGRNPAGVSSFVHLGHLHSTIFSARESP